VDHSLSALDVARPWRTATLVASAVAVIELVILVVAGVALLGKPVAERVKAAATKAAIAPPPRPVAPPPAKEPTAAPRLTRRETSVLVLNGNGRTGAAGEAALRIRGIGYVVGGVGNAPRSDYAKTVVMYRPGYRAEGARLGRDLRIRIVGPLDGLKVRQLMGAHLAVVLGS
jgi:hypothetical protein